MSKFSASDAAFSGFRLVRENLKTVAIWAGVMTVVSILTNVAAIQFFGPQLEAFLGYMQDNNNPDPDEFFRLASALSPLTLWMLPISLIQNGVTFAALNRLVLRHDDSRMAYLRLGKDELRQAAVWLLTALVLMGALFLGSAVTGFLGAMGGATGAFLALAGLLGSFCAVIWLAIRLSFAPAVTFDTGKITLFKSMPQTKGLFWPLLGAYFLAAVMSIIVVLLIWTIVSAVGLIASGDFAATGKMMRADTSSLAAYFTPAGVVQALFSGVIQVLTTLIVFAPPPSIYKELKDREAPPAPSAGNGGW
ncbi:hypothetical protein [Caulobacter sp. RHG1]|uniref:hypothetical protein n=1 Tax=Caulobacter sp. (strain RHG1) TaxID=2545762 RepID=UPI0015578976|nr:hypothetical protein [Caulobacter sp. RHG1]NQE62551.1 hypothetical protein [Caulobacter sp. RHG1]